MDKLKLRVKDQGKLKTSSIKDDNCKYVQVQDRLHDDVRNDHHELLTPIDRFKPDGTADLLRKAAMVLKQEPL